MRTQVANRVHIVVALGSIVKLSSEGMHVTPPWTVPTIINEDAEDICLTSDGRGDKGNLVLNKKEKKEEVQDDRPLHIKCTVIT